MLERQAQVFELIDQGTRKWKANLVSETFNETEAKVIESIPLSPLQAHDRPIWHCTKKLYFFIFYFFWFEMLIIWRWRQ
jgi:hypothetical protein